MFFTDLFIICASIHFDVYPAHLRVVAGIPSRDGKKDRLIS